MVGTREDEKLALLRVWEVTTPIAWASKLARPKRNELQFHFLWYRLSSVCASLAREATQATKHALLQPTGLAHPSFVQENKQALSG